MKKIPIAAALMLLCSSISFAQGGLMVNPKRVVLDDRHRIGAVTLFNSSNDTASFAISLLHYQMAEAGGYIEIPDSIHTYDSTYCDSYVRFFPQAVTLPPHQSQEIRIRFMKPMNLPTREFRSHLYFRALQAAAPIEQKVRDTADHTISLILRPIFGISIPLIVRNGEVSSSETLDSGGYTVTPTDTGDYGIASANLNRTGNESCYGSVVVFFKNKDGQESQVGIVKGIAVYTEIPTRKVQVAFLLPKGVDPSTGTLRMEYQTLTDSPKEQVLAMTNLASK